MQSIADSHLLGYQYGQRNGDLVSGALNYQFYLQISFFSGQSLPVARVKSRDFAHELLQRKQQFLLNGSSLLHLQAVALIEGLEFVEEENSTDKLPTWDDIAKSQAGSNLDFSFVVSLLLCEFNLHK